MIPDISDFLFPIIAFIVAPLVLIACVHLSSKLFRLHSHQSSSKYSRLGMSEELLRLLLPGELLDPHRGESMSEDTSGGDEHAEDPSNEIRE